MKFCCCWLCEAHRILKRREAWERYKQEVAEKPLAKAKQKTAPQMYLTASTQEAGKNNG